MSSWFISRTDHVPGAKRQFQKKLKLKLNTFPPSILKGDFCPLSEDELPSYSTLSSACEDVDFYF